MITIILKRSFIALLIMLQITIFPRLALAAEEGISTTTPTGEVTGPTAPTGADSTTYIYNETTGLWENDFYTWNPNTKQTSPKTQQDYSYNPETGKWDTKEYRYDAPTGSYVPNNVTTNPTTPTNPSPEKLAETTKVAENTTPTSVTATGPDSATTTNSTTNTNGNFNLFYNANISNNVQSSANSGDATVASNTLGGNAGTGNASDMATILNMLQSVWNPNNGQIQTFTADINGDVVGDLTINPTAPNANLTSTEIANTNLKINADQNATIQNNISLAASTGDATVDSNTAAGDATSGTAHAVANVVNMLNSYITSGQSFIGTVNINGNLDGDILLPREMITQLLDSNVPRADININDLNSSTIMAQFNDTTTINNNVTADASTGSAHVAGNTNAGNATSGNANTNVTILNLTGREIVGSNAMLVFVNVLGKWVGMIMDTPGATTAVLGGNITKNSTTETNADISSNNSVGITNNIDLLARSGDADVTNNTKAGNATTGNATASANIANISNSNVSLNGWFGLLFINVFGNWLGSFGVNTAAGNRPVSPSVAQSDIQVFRFTPSSSNKAVDATPSNIVYVPTSGNIGTGLAQDQQVTSPTSGTVLGTNAVAPVYAGGDEVVKGMNPFVRAYGITAIIGIALAAFSKLFSLVRSRKLVA